jgi:hypothetical protein
MVLAVLIILNPGLFVQGHIVYWLPDIFVMVSRASLQVPSLTGHPDGACHCSLQTAMKGEREQICKSSTKF